MPYKVDTGSDGNIMSFNIYKKLFPKATMELLAATRDTKIKLKCMSNISNIIRHMQSKIRTQMKSMQFVYSSMKWTSIIRYARYFIIKHPNYKLQHNRYRKEDKDANLSTNKIITCICMNAGIESY